MSDPGVDPAARSRKLLELVYAQLRATAQKLMAGERSGHTLTATALVHEAYARLVGNTPVAWSNRAHFFAAAAEAMRRILIEHARARHRLKRGGGGGEETGSAAPRNRVPLSIVEAAHTADPETILALDEAIDRLEREEPDVAAVVRFRFFAGLSGDETAAALGLSPRQVDRLWAYARARLFRNIQGGS
jgi:RNA polymerase sigma factor (TIGR02999 family)